MGPKPNQAFLDLKQHILLENKVFAARQDLKLQATTLLCSNCFNQNEINQQIELLLENFVSNFENNASDISSAYNNSLLFYLASRNKIQIPKSLYEYINSTVFRAIETTHYPLSLKGLILFFLSESSFNIPQMALNIDKLKTEAIENLNNKNIPGAIDGFFGVQNIEDKDITTIVNSVKEDPNIIGREKISKLAIMLIRQKKPEHEEIITILEDLIANDFEYWITPDIQFALIESEKLINSNLPSELINEILETLKKSGEEWTGTIDNIQERGVLVDLTKFSRMPSFSPIEDALSLMALTEANRIMKYELTKAEFDFFKYLGKVDNEKKIGTLSGGITLTVLSFLIGILLTLNTLLRWGEIIKSVATISTLVISPSTLMDWITLIYHPIVISSLLLYWEYRVVKKYLCKRCLSVGESMCDFPIFGGLIIKLFRGEE